MAEWKFAKLTAAYPEVWEWAFDLIAMYGPCVECGGPMDARAEWEPHGDAAVMYYEARCPNRLCTEYC